MAQYCLRCLLAKAVLQFLCGIAAANAGARSFSAPDRRLYICNATQPMLWRATKGTDTVYIVGSYHVKEGALQPSALVTQAVGCADVGYFELPCSASRTGGMGQYLSHCSFYPVSLQHQDAIALRLDAGKVNSLQAAFTNIANNAAPGCEAKAAQLKSSIAMLNSTSFRMALYPYYYEAVKLLNSNLCDIGTNDLTYVDTLRSMFDSAGRPTFGLDDIKAQCDTLQANTIQQDKELADFIIQTYGTQIAVQNIVSSESALLQILQCGDLNSLAGIQPSLSALPWLSQRVIADRNAAMAAGIQQAAAKHAGQTISTVIGALHLADIGSTKSVLTLLLEAGFTVTRAAQGTSLGCTASTVVAPGAAKLGLCLAPPFQVQPQSCLNFTAGFAQKVGNDTLYGRQRDDAECTACSNANTSCSCQVLWTNTSGFEELCAQPIGGVTGAVLDMDLTRNPRSAHPDALLTQKTIKSLTQECYATTCDTQFLAEMALRSWYSKYGDLPEGSVALRSPVLRAATMPPTGASNSNGSSETSFPLWAWILIGLLLIALLVALVVAFARKSRKPKNKSRSARIQEDESDYDSSLPGLQTQMTGYSQASQYEDYSRPVDFERRELLPAPQPPQQLPTRQSVPAAFNVPGLAGIIQQQKQEWEDRRYAGLGGVPAEVMTSPSYHYGQFQPQAQPVQPTMQQPILTTSASYAHGAPLAAPYR